MAQSAVITAPIAYDTAGLEAGLAAAVVLVAEARARTHMTTSRMLGDTALAGLAAAVVLVAEARARTHMTTSRMLGDTALAGLAAAVVLVAEARAQPRARRKARIFVDFLRKICKDEQVGNVHTISVRNVQTQV